MQRDIRHPSRTLFAVFLLIALALTSSGCKKTSTTPILTPAATATPTPRRITFGGIGAHGIFDPSLAKDPSSSRLWMSYSAVDPSVAWPTQNPNVVSTRLAYSDDQGATWTDFGCVNPVQDVDLTAFAPTNAGTWQNEVSSLVFDPGAPTSERWKLIFHHYLVLNNIRSLAAHSWLGMKVAASPADLALAVEKKLFSATTYDHVNDSTTGPTKSPLAGAPSIALDTAFPALDRCIFSEPALMATSNSLYLALLCANVDTSGGTTLIHHRVDLLGCGSPCDTTVAGSWTYLGSVLQDAQAAALGFDQGFSAPDLWQSGTDTYLSVTPVSSTPFDGYYNGCRIFKFSNLSTASLSSTLPTFRVDGLSGSFNGAGTYLPEATGCGFLYSQVESATDRFRIMDSGVRF